MEVGFYAQNRRRTFPFLDGSTGIAGGSGLRALPNDAVVDAGFVLFHFAGFDTAVHHVYLDRIDRDGDVFTFLFGSDAPGLAGLHLQFQRDRTAPLYTAQYADIDDSEVGSQSLDLCREPLWSGYLVTGDLAALAELLPSGESLSRDSDADAVLEPALLQNLRSGYVASVNLANADRTRITAPEGCPPVTWPFATGLIYENAVCLTGDILLQPGYNCDLMQDSAGGSLIVSAAVGAGAGQLCSEVPLFSGEAPPDDSDLLEGGPTCQQTVRSFNGVGGPLLAISAGTGAVVTDDPDNNKIVIDVNMLGLAVCAEDASQISQIV